MITFSYLWQNGEDGLIIIVVDVDDRAGNSGSQVGLLFFLVSYDGFDEAAPRGAGLRDAQFPHVVDNTSSSSMQGKHEGALLGSGFDRFGRDGHQQPQIMPSIADHLVPDPLFIATAIISTMTLMI